MVDLYRNLKFKDQDPDVKGFHEVIFSVSNLERTKDFFVRVCGWEVLFEGTAKNDLKQSWHLGDEVKIVEVLLRNPGDTEGYLRLVSFKNVEQQQIRSATNIWDTGGIFDVNMRVPNMEAFYKILQQEGWNGVTDPQRYVFGEYDVSEVLMKGPDGIVIAFMQRFAPPLKGFDHMNKTSRIFNSTVTVSDPKQMDDFFVNKLGFHMFFQTPGDQRQHGHNVIGIPPNINGSITVPVAIVRPNKNTYGSIEYMRTIGLEGKDCSALAKPPNLGILMYRFPVRDAKGFANQLVENGVQLNTPVKDVNIAPYGNMKVFSIRTPDGAWMEFMQLL